MNEGYEMYGRNNMNIKTTECNHEAIAMILHINMMLILHYNKATFMLTNLTKLNISHSLQYVANEGSFKRHHKIMVKLFLVMK